MSTSGTRRARTAAADAGIREPLLAWPGDPAALTAADVDIEALAHVLANTCRFGGRTRRFYSVAQRAVIASEEIAALDGLGDEERRTLALHALVADARIAWLGDADSGGPASARAAERARREGAAVDRAVREAAGLHANLSGEQADLLRFVARMTDAAERRDLPDAGMGAPAGAAFPPLKGRIRPHGPDRAVKLWLARYRELAAPPPAGSGAGANPTDDEKETGDVADVPQTKARKTPRERTDDEARPLAA